MFSQQPRYYRPYQSDDDEKSEVSSESSDSSLSDDIDDRIGSPLALVKAGGPSMLNLGKQIDFRIQPSKKGVQYYPFDLSGEFDPSLPYTGTTFDMNTGTQTSILIINSRDRDRNVYPQPTQFTLRVPRVYRNITSFQILQLKLLSAFFYFSPEKENTDISILENGRLIPNQLGQLVPNTIKSIIRTGTYDITSLLSELQTQLNRTPLFFDFPNGIQDFIPQFTSTGDLGLGFNQPGDTFFDSLRGEFENSPTMALIVSYFFPSQFAGLSSYTLDQIKYAYYYPVLYECFLDPLFGPSTLNLTLTTSSLLTGETIDQRILYTSQGLNDPVIGELINNNLAKLHNSTTTNILDFYRLRNTFRFFLVNEYTCKFQTFNNRINITSSSLNTSLVNLINLQSSKFLAAELQRLGLTIADFAILQSTVQVNTAIITNMYNLLQSNLAVFFGVDFNTFAPVFFNDLSNSLFIQNGVGATGVDTGYTLDVLQRANAPITSSQSNFTDTKVYWPNMKNLNGSINGPFNLRDASNVPYNIPSKSFGSERFIDSSNTFINVDLTTKSGDIVTPIQPGKYTVFRFRSPVRQTLQVETLPLPYYYRFPEYNKLEGGNIARYFDTSYSYVTNTYNQSLSNLGQADISNIQVVYNRGFSSSLSAAAILPLQVQKSVFYFQFATPKPTDLATDSSGFTYTMNMSAVATNSSFGTGTNLFLYHDRGAFMADVSGLRNEIPYHYKKESVAFSDSSMNTIQFRAYANQEYYAIFRTTGVTFPTTQFRFLTWFQNPNSSNVVFDLSGFDPAANPFSRLDNLTYARQYDSNFIRLPTASNLMGLDPDSDVFNETLPISEPPIGYDISGGVPFAGVSSDLTDYKGFATLFDLSNVPFSQFRKDPLTNFTFQKISPYDPNSQSYFYSGSSNAILTPFINRTYNRGIVSQRQYKLVHWYDYNYIGQQKDEIVPAANDVATMTPFTSASASLAGYTYGTSNFLQLGKGVIGFTFLPPEGVWSVQSFFFKSAWDSSTTDCSNSDIKYIGIFRTDTVSRQNIGSLHLSNAFQVLEFEEQQHFTSAEIASNNGFDARGGTYYKFTINPAFLTSNSNTQLIGFTPGTNALLSNVTSLYSVIAFTESLAVTNMYLLAGSLVPYPEVSDASSTEFYFGTRAPTNKNMIIPRPKPAFNPAYSPSNGNIFQSQYEQSAGIGTQVLHFKDFVPAVTEDASGMFFFTLNGLIDFQGTTLGPFVPQTLDLLAITSSHIYAKVPNAYIFSGPSNFSQNPVDLMVLYPTSGASRQLSNSFGRASQDYDLIYGSIREWKWFWCTSTFCTSFTSNGYLNTSNIIIYKDTNKNFFQDQDQLFNFFGIFEQARFMNSLKYVVNNQLRWAIIYTQQQGAFYEEDAPASEMVVGQSNTAVGAYVVQLRGFEGTYHVNFPDEYAGGYGGGSSYGGGGGYNYGPSGTDNLLGDGGMSITMDVSSNFMYILPYDQYDYVTPVNTGSNLYKVDISREANPPSSAIGFTKGTVVLQFVGTPSRFTYVNFYKEDIVLLRTVDNDAIFYITSSNLISSNENFSVFQCVTAPIAQSLKDISGNPLTTITNFISGAAGQVMIGSAGTDIYGYNNSPQPYVFNFFDGYNFTDPFGSPVAFATDFQTMPDQNYPLGYAARYQGVGSLINTVVPEFYNVNPDSNLFVGPTGESNQLVFDPPRSNFYFVGTRNNQFDLGDTLRVNEAWQIFYPNFKINLTKTANSSSPITNTTDLTTYEDYSHTSLFYYKDFTKMVSDISGKFAFEKSSNFVTSDVSSGYFFYSYINNINLEKSTNYSNSDNSSYNYLAVRGYSPTEKFNCLVRFFLPGRYDFGFLSLFDIMQEAQKTVLVDLSGSSEVNPSYFSALLQYNNAFKLTSNFGNNSVPGFGGSNLTFTGFSNFMVQYKTLFTSGLSNANLVNRITGNVLSNLRLYIQQNLGSILPSYVLQRDNFTQSLTFSILFESSLSPQRRALDDEWGLGYNLGFAKQDTPDSTVQRATSFFKILDDFIYLRLNQEFTMNRMDTCSREDLSITHEPTGATNQYAAKLLLAPFGNFATVLVQNPINFNPVLTSLDRLSFQWVDAENITIDNDESEWNAVVQIQEQVTAPRVGSTIPQPKKK